MKIQKKNVSDEFEVCSNVIFSDKKTPDQKRVIKANPKFHTTIRWSTVTSFVQT